MKKIKPFWLLSFVFALLFIGQVSAETIHDCETVQSGIWEDAANWTNCNDLYPGLNSDGDDRTATIKTNHIMTLGLESLSLVGFTMEDDSELIVDDQFNQVEFIVNPEPFDAGLGQITVNADNFVINAQFNEAVLGNIDGDTHLTVLAESIIRFNGDIGQVTPLQSLTTPNPVASSVFNSTRAITLNGITDSAFESITMNPGAVVTVGHTGPGQLIFNGPIEKFGNSPQRLFINKDNGDVLFYENVELGQLVVSGNGSTIISAAEMKTVSGPTNGGEMRFDTEVIIADDVAFIINSNVQGLVFNETLKASSEPDTSSHVVISTSNVARLNRVGENFSPIGSLTVSGTGSLELNGSIVTTGIQDYQVPIIQNQSFSYISQSSVVEFSELISGVDNNNINLDMAGYDYELSNIQLSGINRLLIIGSGTSVLTSDWTTSSRVIILQELEVGADVTMTSRETDFLGDIVLDGGNLTLNASQVIINRAVNNAGNDEKLIIELENDDQVIRSSFFSTFNVEVDVLMGTFLPVTSQFNADLSIKNTALFKPVQIEVDGSLNIQNGGTLILDTSISDVTPVNALNYPSGAQKTKVTISGTVPVWEHGQIAVQDGPVILGGALETEITMPSPIQTGDQFLIIDNRSANPVVNFFDGLPEGGITNDGFFSISYMGGDGNDVVLTAACSQTIEVINDVTNPVVGATTFLDDVADACDGAVLTFSPELDVDTISLFNTILVDKSLTMNGDGINLRGPNSASLFEITAGNTLNLNQINIINTTGDGAILNEGTFNANEVYFSENTQTNVSPGGGGAIHNLGEANITKSAFYRNNAERGGAIFNGDSGVMNITNSTFYENGQTDAIEGGAIHNQGSMTLINSTLVDSGGGNVAGNTIINTGQSASLILQNTVIEAASPLLECINNDGASMTELNNFIDDGSCDATLFGFAGLAPWNDNGGYANTISPLPNSQLIDAGDDSTCPSDDALGTQRPQRFQCDIGAVEYIENNAPSLLEVTMNATPLSLCQNRTDELASDFGITFSKPMLNASDIMNYILVFAGPDLNFDAPFDADNEMYSFDSLISDNDPNTPRIDLSLNQMLNDGLYRLELASVITDEFANPLSIDGDLIYQFRIDKDNLFNNGDYDDCGGVNINDAWQYVTFGTNPDSSVRFGAPGEFIPDRQDLTASEHSGALRIFSLDPERFYQLDQCQNLMTGLPLNLKVKIELQSIFPTIQAQGGDPNLSQVIIQCEYWDAADCMGNLLNSETENFSEVGVYDTVTNLEHAFNPAPNGTLSANCGLSIRPDRADAFTTLVDGLKLSGQDEIFTNGFEINP